MTSAPIPVPFDVSTSIRRLVSKGPLTFGQLVRDLPGVDPVVVREHLTNGASDIGARVLWAECADIPALDPRLPVPHPLDYDWRFSPATVASLTEELLSYGQRIVLLGAPSLWLALQEDPHPQELHLLDSNPVVDDAATNDRTAVRHLVDLLGDELPTLSPSDVVLADPPWYPDALEAFLWVAARFLRPGGFLFVSVPPEGTRPTVRQERDDLLRWSHGLGLTLRSTREGALRYAMPPFERAALRAAGVAAYVPSDWRQGDLLVFERTDEVGAVRPICSRPRWVERVIDRVRIRIDAGASVAGADPRLISIVDGDVLSSVSRRDPRRAVARVWTSGNRVFGCAEPARLVQIIDGLLTGVFPDEHLAREAATAIQNLVLSERREYICSDERGQLVSVTA